MSLVPAATATGSTAAGLGALIGARLAGGGSADADLPLLPATGLGSLGLAAVGVVLLLVGLALYRLSVRAGMAPGTPVGGGGGRRGG